MSNGRSLLYVVANTVDPYGYELPVILAYPSGCSYRARFKLEWIDPSLERSLSALESQACLIVYRDFETGVLYPLRFGTVREVRKYGGIVYIRYELGTVVPYHESPEARAEQVRIFNEEFGREHPQAKNTNRPGEHMKPLVMRSRYVPRIANRYLETLDAEAQEFESWSNACDVVSQINLYSGMEFVRVVGLEEVSRNRPVPVRTDVYNLAPGRTYELRLAQRIFRPDDIVKPHLTSFKCAGQELVTITQERRAVGKYDVLAFRFQTGRPGVRGSMGVLSIKGQLTEERSLELEILARVRPEWRLRGVVLALVGALCLLWPELVSHVGLGPELQAFVPRIGTLLYVLGVFDSRSLLEYYAR